MTLEAWRTIFSGFTLVTVLFGVLNYWLARNKAKKDYELSKDKEICNQAITALERAYSTLSGGNGHSAVPDNSRLNWLTTSRQIVRFKKLKAKLKTDLYTLVCSEHEEHWRHQFYLCLDQNEILVPAYFQGEMFMPNSSENIDPKSALVIFNFKQWDPELNDPLDDVDDEQLINDGYTLSGQHGFRSYLDIMEDERTRRNAS